MNCSLSVAHFLSSVSSVPLSADLRLPPSSALYSALLLCSHPSSRLPSPHPPFSSVRFVLWLQRLNLLAKHTKLLSCKSIQVQEEARKKGGGEKKDPRTFSTISWASECVAVALHLVCNYGEERCVCTFQKEVSAQDQFSTPSLKCHNDFFTILPPSHPPKFYARCEFHQRSIKASNAQQPTGTNYQLDSRIIHPWSWVEQGGAAALNM